MIPIIKLFKNKPVKVTDFRDTDENLLFWYKVGFREELEGNPKEYADTETFDMCLSILCKRAFFVGCQDAKLGDDNPNIDYQSDEDIIKRIRE